jgi:hypothetical protein
MKQCEFVHQVCEKKITENIFLLCTRNEPGCIAQNPNQNYFPLPSPWKETEDIF